MTGIREEEWPEVSAMLAEMATGLKLLAKKLGRMPEQHEADMIWSAIQRHHDVNERDILPVSQRRQ